MQALSFIFIPSKSYHSTLALSIVNMPFFVALALRYGVLVIRSVLFAITAFLSVQATFFFICFQFSFIIFLWIANDISVNKKSMQTGCSLHAFYYRYCFGISTGLYFRGDIAQAECPNTRGARSTWDRYPSDTLQSVAGLPVGKEQRNIFHDGIRRFQAVPLDGVAGHAADEVLGVDQRIVQG